jgi:tetratricopeptide (TPR) repeat protein
MAHLPAQAVADAARELSRSGRWAHAKTLLTSARQTSSDEAGVIALAHAEVEAEWCFWMRRDADSALIDAAIAMATDDAQRWAAQFARLRSTYATQLRARLAQQPLAGVAELTTTADELIAKAPDATTRAHANFYRALIADVLCGDAGTGEAHYRAALNTEDGYVRSFALRHLGGTADDAGRHDEALELWRESTRLRQRAGYVPGVLAQLQLYPGDTTPDAIVTEWADALGLGELFRSGTTTMPEVARDPA